MTRAVRGPALALLILLAASSSRLAVSDSVKSAATIDVPAILKVARERHGVPGMAAAIVSGWDIEAIGADGVRKAGSDAAVTVDDRWHLGSDTKAITATLCAMLADEGKLGWDTTLAKAFPDAVAKGDAAWKDVTLEQLLTQRSGVPTDLSRDGLWSRLWAFRGPASESRHLLLEGILPHPPEPPPGTKFVYANANFAIAGHMAEHATGVPWETLVEKRLFAPLGIKSAGFGAPGSAGKTDQPWGHRADGTPMDPGDPQSDNPVAIAPAGRAHMTVGDWAKFVAFHVRGAQGDERACRLVKPQSFARLQTPPSGFDYAMGWIVTARDWAPGPILTHAGSNTMWYCVTWVAPKGDFAVLVACNRGGDEAAKACDEVSGALIQAHRARLASAKR